MAYKPLTPPFALHFRQMPKSQLRAYYKWFMEQIPNRIEILESKVRETVGFENWKADESVDSLTPLGCWFERHVETRKLSETELSAKIEKLKFPMEIPDWDLSHRTFSYCVDIGMYFALVVKRQYPHVKWELMLRKTVDYGVPVLVGFGFGEFNPPGMMIVLAYGLAKKTKNGNHLLKLYERWSSKTVVPSESL